MAVVPCTARSVVRTPRLHRCSKVEHQFSLEREFDHFAVNLGNPGVQRGLVDRTGGVVLDPLLMDLTNGFVDGAGDDHGMSWLEKNRILPGIDAG